MRFKQLKNKLKTKTMNTVFYLATDKTFTLYINGQHRVIEILNNAHRKQLITAANELKQNFTQENLDALENIISPMKKIIFESDSRLELDENGQLYLAGTDVPMFSQLTQRILDFCKSNLPIEPYLHFWSSCLRNPSMEAIKELFDFTEENHLPLTEDGAILGYKMLTFTESTILPSEFEGLFIDKNGQVRKANGHFADADTKERFKTFISEGSNPEMVDSYSKSVKQKVGDIVNWNDIYPNRPIDYTDRRECSRYGFHVGSFNYSFYGDVRVLCKVFPEHVINANIGQSKFRTAQYEIVAFIDKDEEVKQKLIEFRERKEEEKLRRESIGSDFDIDGEYCDDDYDFDFSVGDVVVSLVTAFGLNKNEKYYVIDIDDDDNALYIFNGEECDWYDAGLFERVN